MNRSSVSRPHIHRRKFWYENGWHSEPGFKELVAESWHTQSTNSVISKLSSCAEDIVVWSRDHYDKLELDIEDCRRQIQNVRLNSSGLSQDSLLSLRKKMSRLLSQEDAYWCQRAKTHWYKYGDRNTKNFHASATARKKVNQILSLEDDASNKIVDSAGMCDIARNCFVELFQKHISATTPVLHVICQSVSMEDNAMLTAPFTKEEFHLAMFSMHPDKCLGPDGFNPGFYHQFGTFVVMIFLRSVVSGLQ